MSDNKNLTIIFYFITLLHLISTQDPHSSNPQLTGLTSTQVWGFGILTGLGISLMGFAAAIILVLAQHCCSNTIFNTVIKFLFSLAFGALLGDAVLHILSQAFANSDINAILASLIFIGSIIIFIFIDRLLHAYGVAHSHWIPGQHDHQHNHNNQQKINSQQTNSKKISNIVQHQNINSINNSLQQINENKPINQQPQITINNQIIISNQKIIKPIINTPENQPQLDSSKQTNLNFKQKVKICCQNLKGKQSKGYMNILGSFIHNFIDGLAIGVTFATGNRKQIISVVVAIVAHQIPRQLGDVAILLKSRFSSIQTILCNGTINFLSLFGVIIGLTAINLNEIAQLYIMVSVAGNFIYIASDIWQNLFKNKGDKAKLYNFIQFLGAAIGIATMVGIKLLEG